MVCIWSRGIRGSAVGVINPRIADPKYTPYLPEDFIGDWSGWSSEEDSVIIVIGAVCRRGAGGRGGVCEL